MYINLKNQMLGELIINNNNNNNNNNYFQVPYGLPREWLERFVDSIRDGLVSWSFLQAILNGLFPD